MTINLNKNLIPIAIIIAGALIAGAFVYINQEGGGALSPQEAAEKAIAFINQTIEEDVTASLVSITDEGEIYKIRLKIQDTEYDSFITKDGKFVFPYGFNLEEQTQEETTPAETETPSYTSLDYFAQCLTEKKMKFYSSKNCPWCDKEKELFGDSLQYVTYIECVDETTGGWAKECQEAEIESVPTWQLPDGKMESGFKTLEQLAEVSGCPLQ